MHLYCCIRQEIGDKSYHKQWWSPGAPQEEAVPAPQLTPVAYLQKLIKLCVVYTKERLFIVSHNAFSLKLELLFIVTVWELLTTMTLCVVYT